MFPVYVMDQNYSEPKDDIYYVIANNGMFVKKKLGLIESLTPVDSIPFLDQFAVPFAKMTIPKIPKPIFCKIFLFFRKIHEMYGTESEAFILYHPKKKKFVVKIPFQIVSRAGCKAVRPPTPKNYETFCSIHSHANFGAFHSGVDLKDEEYFEGLHITVGNVRDTNFSIVASIVSNKKRFAVEPSDYIEGLNPVNAESTRYIVEGLEEFSFKRFWLNFVEKEPEVTFPVVTGYRQGYDYLFDIYGIKTKIDEPRSRTPSWKSSYQKIQKKNDPCLSCPFHKDKEDIITEDLVETPEEKEALKMVEDLFPEFYGY